MAGDGAKAESAYQKALTLNPTCKAAKVQYLWCCMVEPSLVFNNISHLSLVFTGWD